MQAQHHGVCSLSEGIAFFVVSEQKDGDSADNSAASSYGLMRSGAVTGTHFSRAPFTAPDLAFLRHLLGSDEGVKQLVFILVRGRFSLRFFSYHAASAHYTSWQPFPDRAVDKLGADQRRGINRIVVTRDRYSFSTRRPT